MLFCIYEFCVPWLVLLMQENHNISVQWDQAVSIFSPLRARVRVCIYVCVEYLLGTLIEVRIPHKTSI